LANISRGLVHFETRITFVTHYKEDAGKATRGRKREQTLSDVTSKTYEDWKRDRRDCYEPDISQQSGRNWGLRQCNIVGPRAPEAQPPVG